jgi:Thermopsin
MPTYFRPRERAPLAPTCRRPRALRPRLVALAIVALFVGGPLLLGHFGTGLNSGATVPTFSRGLPHPEFGPAHAPAHPGVAPPRPSGVSPYTFHTTEPAPAGVTDYGVDASQVPYSYTTPVFLGTVSIRNLTTFESGAGPSAYYMTFQLNVVVRFTNGPNELDYWIQDVVSLNTSVKDVGFLDNVWNLSSSAGQLGPSDLSGNGTTNTVGSTTWYADGAPFGLPGNYVTLHYPATISVRVVSSDIAGTPHVAFEYQDGFGWVSYDNVSFNSARGYADHGFYVTGTRYAPIGIFFDAEFDFTGPSSGGAASNDLLSNLNMTLDRWNGHNYQAVANAYNFGSNTGELLQNYVSSRAVGAADGTLYAHEVNGAGTLGLLYDDRNVSFLNASAPTVAVGTLYVGGTPHSYIGGDVNLTLGPGTYALRLDGPSGVVTSLNITLGRGEYRAITLAQPLVFVATFTPMGLPPGTPWSVDASGVVHTGNATSLAFNETNGTYSFIVGPVPGFVAALWVGTFVVAGVSETIVINFTRSLYAIDFASLNRPSGAFWGVTIGADSSTSNGSTLVLREPNGTYTFRVTTNFRYEVTPASAMLVVAGGSIVTSVSFALRAGYLTGVVAPFSAIVTVDGNPIGAPGGVFNATVLPGTHTIAASAAGFVSYSANETVTAGNATDVTITLKDLATPSTTPAATGPLPSWAFVGVVIAVVVAAAVVAGAYVASRRPRHP